jgi:ArsR family transcriptional regulator
MLEAGVASATDIDRAMELGYRHPMGPLKLTDLVGLDVRLAILDLLRDGEACVCHLEAALDQRQAYISQQLSLLRDAGLVEDRREGWRIYYHVTSPQVFEIMDAVGRLTGCDTPRQSRTVLDDCSCPACESKKEMVT